MGVLVLFRDRKTTLSQATKWYIDPGGRLHVTNDETELAVFNTGVWDSVIAEKTSEAVQAYFDKKKDAEEQWDKSLNPTIYKEPKKW